MNISQQRLVLAEGPCEVRFDAHTRRLYATDASIYQIEPIGVAFPRTNDEVVWLLGAASEAETPIIPRGAGTGLAGGAVGEGVVVNLARYNRRISELNLERGSVRVEPGVVLDELNAFLKPHGYCFGPDVATSSRATLGGMIANNSSGARAPLYGTTAEHLLSLRVALADGRTVDLGPEHDGLAAVRAAVDEITEACAGEINKRFPQMTVKRSPGYGLDRYLRNGRDLTQIVCGSEGTLALILSAELRLSPLPKEKGLALIFFASIAEAMQAGVALLDLKPAAVEHIDRALFDQTRDQLAFRAARDLLRLDTEPCEAILIVEFYDHVADRLDAVAQRHFGLRSMTVTDSRQMEMVWALRKAGLSLLTGRKGPAKPAPGIEDVAVLPHQLPDYVAAVQDTMTRLGLEGSFYGHAGSGLLHIRPIVDLHKQEDIVKYRKLTEEISTLANAFGASLAGEHGVGIARTEFLPAQLGPDLLGAMREIKRLFDPGNLLNPGKIVPVENGRPAYRIDSNLRAGPEHRIEVPFVPVLRFRAKDESFIGNLEQCNGCGACLKSEPTMCPTFPAIGEEVMSTRGRANTVRAVLERQLNGSDGPLTSRHLDTALSNCLSCKACTTECPSNVNMSLLKADLLHAKQKTVGLTIRERLVSSVDLLGRLGCIVPRLSNAVISSPFVRRWMDRRVGFSAKRPFPPFATQRFDVWFRRRSSARRPAPRGRVILWDDTFVRYFEPDVGRAAVTVLEAAGYAVAPAHGRRCCGRPAFSVGRLDKARTLGMHNVRMFLEQGGDEPIVFLEPSCYSMFVEDYAELDIPGAQDVAQRCVLFEEFIETLLEREPGALRFRPDGAPVAVHAHCHVKALRDPRAAERVLRRLPNADATYLETGCCGMAGQFGQLSEKYDLSVRVARPLVEKINGLRPDTQVVACGVSCRHQIGHLTAARPVHIAQVLAERLDTDAL